MLVFHVYCVIQVHVSTVPGIVVFALGKFPQLILHIPSASLNSKSWLQSHRPSVLLKVPGEFGSLVQLTTHNSVGFATQIDPGTQVQASSWSFGGVVPVFVTIEQSTTHNC